MPTGRYSPNPQRYGGPTPTLQALIEALNAARGTAYATGDTTAVYAENEALARCLWAAHEQNRRLALQADPRRTTDMLGRWERILGVVPAYGATGPERRAVVAERFSRIGAPGIGQELEDRLSETLGSLYVSLERIALADALQYWPSGTPSTTNPWYSTTAHLRVQVQRPTAMPIGEFWNALGVIGPLMENFLPAWATWDWFTVSPSASPGPEGFFLDDENNLDHEVFD